jgi:membrane-bound lytic murein transglycosylase B
MRGRRGQSLPVLITAALLATPAVGAEFGRCLETIRSEAIAEGVQPTTADRLLTGVKPNPRVIELDRRQPEFVSTLAGYLERRVSEARIRAGAKRLKTHQALLTRIQRDYGVPARYLVAFWGLETNYGRYVGTMNTVRSLATLACDRRRGAFFRGELIAALQLVDRGTLESEQLAGSWAGALGNFQFLPSVYRDHAIDADGDGRRDLWQSLPDAMESAAAFLRARGWRPGERWGREVLLPDGFDFARLEDQQSVAEWADLGLTKANGRPLPAAALPARLLLPAGVDGPAFLVYPNFDVIMRWNPSRLYALSVGLLADRLAGAGSLRNPPPAQPAMPIRAVRALQRRLNALGHDAGPVDGRVGPKTRAALRTYQKTAGLIADGYPDTETLRALGVEIDTIDG